jgi:hypothetical protein
MNSIYKIEINTLFEKWTFNYTDTGWFHFNVIYVLSSKALESPWKFNGPNINYSPSYYIKNVIAVELVVDSVRVSTFRRASVGAFLFGGVGALAGALSSINATPKSKISVAIFLDNIELSTITVPCKTLGEANRLISTFANIESSRINKYNLNTNQENFEKSEIKGTSFSDEIIKLKNLLDEGVIDESEFLILKRKLMD